MRCERLLLVTVLLGCAIGAFAYGQSPLGLMPVPVQEPLSVQLWMDKATYMAGDSARVMFTVNQPAYIYLFNIRSDGVVRMIFPNGYNAQNYVSAGTHALPNGMYDFTVEPPAGTDHLQIVASLAPLTLPQPSPADVYPLLGAQPVEALGLIEEQLGAGEGPAVCVPSWATAWCSFVIVAQPEPACPCPPPVSVNPPCWTVNTYCTPVPAPAPVVCPPVPSSPPLAYPPFVMPVPTPPTTYCPPPAYVAPAPTYCPPTPCMPIFGGILNFGFRILFGIDCDD